MDSKKYTGKFMEEYVRGSREEQKASRGRAYGQDDDGSSCDRAYGRDDSSNLRRRYRRDDRDRKMCRVSGPGKYGASRRRHSTNSKTALFLAAFVFLLAASSFFGVDRINAKADSERTSAVEKYYTSIEIQDGDSLWSIASQYKAKSGKTTGELVDELKQMNCLSEDTIHTGHYLVIPYYMED